MVKEYNAIYSVKEVASVLQVSINSVYALMHSGRLPYLQLGAKKVRGSDLERFIESYPVEVVQNQETDNTAGR